MIKRLIWLIIGMILAYILIKFNIWDKFIYNVKDLILNIINKIKNLLIYMT